tara:strand:- start:359 stop:607 length:249 start_codon:yes stop_codon:yes gene_type:complete
LYGRGVRKPAISIKGIEIMVSLASPTTIRSTKFIDNSIANIDKKDILNAVTRATLKGICFRRIRVSRAIDVNIPLTIAKLII